MSDQEQNNNQQPLLSQHSNSQMENSNFKMMNSSVNRSISHQPALYKKVSTTQATGRTLLQTFHMIWISIPNVANYFSLWILFFAYLKASEMFHEENKLTAYALSFMWTNALGYALIVSLNIGFMAMSSQAIGAGQKHLVSHYFQRTQVISFILIAVLTVVMAFTGKIFNTFADPQVADYSQEFMTLYIPSLYFYIIFDSTRQCFNAHTHFTLPNVLVLCTYAIHFLWCWLFIGPLKMGMYGLGLARTVTEALNAIIIVIIVKVKGYFPYVKFMWTRTAFRGWYNLLKFTLPMGSIIYMDWIASEMMTIFVTALKDEDAASGHSAFITIQVLFVVFFLGLGVTVEPFVGQAMGEKDIKGCKQLRKQTLIGSLFLSITVSIICFLVETPLAKAFTNTVGEEVNFIKAYRIMNYIIVHFYSISMTMGSILRATGQQNSAFFLPLFYYFVIGIPLQYLFVFTAGWGLQGSWYAYAITCALNSLSYLYIVYRTDYEKQVEVVKKNMQYQLNLIFDDAKKEGTLSEYSQYESKQHEQELAQQILESQQQQIELQKHQSNNRKKYSE